MSDLPSTNHHQPPRARRAGRRRTMASRRAASAKPTPAEGSQLDDELTELKPAAASPIKTPQPNSSTSDRPRLLFDNEEGASAPFWRRLTPLAKQILLWSGIIGVISLAVSIALGLALSPFAQTTADQQKYSGLLLAGNCLDYLFALGLPFVAGWRATTRDGTARHGGLAGVGSVIVAALIGLIIDVVIAAAQGQLQQINGAYFAATGENLLFPLVISFAMGTFGTSYGSWKRRRAQQRQEVIPS